MDNVEDRGRGPERTATRVITLRYAGTCARCGADLPPGTRAAWDRNRRTTTCARCRQAIDGGNRVDTDGPGPSRAHRPAFDVGDKGRSAQAIFDRRHDARAADVRARLPRLGGLILALSDDPQSTKARAEGTEGAEGERRVGAMLDELRSASVVVLHDRRLPRSTSTIDHLVIASSGVHVIDAKHDDGRIELRTTGSLFLPGPNQLFVRGRNRTGLVDAMAAQVGAVRDALGDLLLVPELARSVVHPSLCFEGAEWGWFPKPLVFGAVHVAWPTALVATIGEPGSLSHEEILQLGSRLAQQLPAA